MTPATACALAAAAAVVAATSAVLLLTMTVTSIAVAAQPNKVSNFIDSKGSDTPAGSSVRDALRPGDEGLKAPSFTSDVGPDGKLVYPLDLKLSYKREGHRALGTITITNTLKQPVEVSGQHSACSLLAEAAGQGGRAKLGCRAKALCMIDVCTQPSYKPCLNTTVAFTLSMRRRFQTLATT
jgi:hypothetical protein